MVGLADDRPRRQRTSYPNGEILGELPAGQTQSSRTLIDTGEVINWYLGQRRADLLHLRYRGNALQTEALIRALSGECG